MPVGPLKAQGLMEPGEGIAFVILKIEWYSVKDASICITIHIEAFFIHFLDKGAMHVGISSLQDEDGIILQNSKLIKQIKKEGCKL